MSKRNNKIKYALHFSSKNGNISFNPENSLYKATLDNFTCAESIVKEVDPESRFTLTFVGAECVDTFGCLNIALMSPTFIRTSTLIKIYKMCVCSYEISCLSTF